MGFARIRMGFGSICIEFAWIRMDLVEFVLKREMDSNCVSGMRRVCAEYVRSGRAAVVQHFCIVNIIGLARIWYDYCRIWSHLLGFA